MEKLIKVRLKPGGKYHVRAKGGFRTAEPGEEFEIPERSYNSNKDRFEKIGSEKTELHKETPAPLKPEPEVSQDKDPPSASAASTDAKEDVKENSPFTNPPIIPAATAATLTPEAASKVGMRMVSAGDGKWNVLNASNSKINDIPLTEEQAKSLL